MRDKTRPLNLEKIETYSIHERKSKVRKENFASPWKRSERFSYFLETLPSILAGNDIKHVIHAVSSAALQKRVVCFGMGSHVIKVGIAPVLIDLIEKNIVTMLAMNGSGIIHDLEIALTGKTSEDVAASLENGCFGMAKETADLLNQAIKNSSEEAIGLGKSVGKLINELKLPYRDLSLTATCARLDMPATVHVAIGTDIIHMHQGFDASACGKASHIDFRIFAANVAQLQEGVFINAGSAVILPEVFLKALTLARNVNGLPKRFTTVNLDFLRHYRPMTNVVNRPSQIGATGYSITGHHEILIPLIAAGVIENMG